MAQLKQQGQTHKVSGGMGRGLPPALPSNTPVGSHLQASAFAVPCRECPLLIILIQGTQHAFWSQLGEVIKPRLMKPITALLSPFPLSNGDKESYITEHVSVFTLAARKLRVKFTSDRALILERGVSVLPPSLSSFSQFLCYSAPFRQTDKPLNSGVLPSEAAKALSWALESSAPCWLCDLGQISSPL